MTVMGCHVCKRLPENGHDSWCSPERRAESLHPITPPAPMVTRNGGQTAGPQIETQEQARVLAGRPIASKKPPPVADKAGESRSRQIGLTKIAAATKSKRVPEVEMPTCTRCVTAKPVSAFRMLKRRRDVVCQTCRDGIAETPVVAYRQQPNRTCRTCATEKPKAEFKVQGLGHRPDCMACESLVVVPVLSFPCGSCGADKPSTEFRKYRGGSRAKTCNDCAADRPGTREAGPETPPVLAELPGSTPYAGLVAMLTTERERIDADLANLEIVKRLADETPDFLARQLARIEAEAARVRLAIEWQAGR